MTMTMTPKSRRRRGLAASAGGVVWSTLARTPPRRFRASTPRQRRLSERRGADSFAEGSENVMDYSYTTCNCAHQFVRTLTIPSSKSLAYISRVNKLSQARSRRTFRTWCNG